MTDLSMFAELVPLDNGLCVVSTLRRDGAIHSTVVNAGVLRHPVTGIDVFTAAGGTHDDWDTYDRVMAEERRAAVLVTPVRTYKTPG